MFMNLYKSTHKFKPVIIISTYSFELKFSTKNEVTKEILCINCLISKPINEENYLLCVHTSKLYEPQSLDRKVANLSITSKECLNTKVIKVGNVRLLIAWVMLKTSNHRVPIFR